MATNYSYVDDEEDLACEAQEIHVAIPIEGATLPARLIVPAYATGSVVLAHSGADTPPVMAYLSAAWQGLGLATLELALPETGQGEGRLDEQVRGLGAAAAWLRLHPQTSGLKLGYFAAGSLAAAALQMAADEPEAVSAVVSVDGRPNLPVGVLGHVQAATLLLAAEGDEELIQLNQRVRGWLSGPRQLATLAGPHSLLAEPAHWPDLGRLAGNWFARYL